jgi:hypothetical protein
MEKRVEMSVTLTVKDYSTAIKVGDLMCEMFEHLGVLSNEISALEVNYKVNGKDRGQVLLYALNVPLNEQN